MSGDALGDPRREDQSGRRRAEQAAPSAQLLAHLQMNGQVRMVGEIGTSPGKARIPASTRVPARCAVGRLDLLAHRLHSRDLDSRPGTISVPVAPASRGSAATPRRRRRRCRCSGSRVARSGRDARPRADRSGRPSPARRRSRRAGRGVRPGGRSTPCGSRREVLDQERLVRAAEAEIVGRDRLGGPVSSGMILR